ncbi:MAG: hypothetical protein H6669_15390 [Ardenticatenaceae bacterium]|nr:hypothetical protein [Ardenticatenaceae bacterium]
MARAVWPRRLRRLWKLAFKGKDSGIVRCQHRIDRSPRHLRKTSALAIVTIRA